jgi:dihydrodipicolinate synthase/N-acetylneuraminate lyase
VVVVSDWERELATDVIVELSGHPGILGVVDDRAAERVEELKAGSAGVKREVTVTTVFAAVTGRMLRESAGSLLPAARLGGGAAVAVGASTGLRTRTKTVGFQVLCGSTTGMLAAWQSGAAGAVPRLGAASPQACCEVYQAWKDGELAVAEEKQARVRAAALRMEGFSGVAWSKYGCDLNGYFGGRPRLPLFGLNGAQREELEREMSGLKS